MRIARIDRPDALYDAGLSAKTFETIDESILNRSDFDEIAAVYSTVESENITHKHIQRHGEFMLKFRKV